MKTLITAIAVFCFSFALYGQTETIKPLLTKDKIWSTGYSLLGDFSNSEYFKVWKDSIVDNKTYSFIINSIDEFHENWDTLSYYLFMEQENKVYFENYLYYDFTMQVGDTINFGFDLVVDSVIWQPILNGENRKHWYLSTPDNKYNHVVWVEGIGSLGGLIDPTGGANMVGGGTDLLCVHENGEQIYQSPYYDGCYVKLKEDSILPLLTKGKTWSVAQFSTGSIPYKIESCYTLKTDTDTIIYEKTYLKLLISYDAEQSNWTSYHKYLCQENEKVYYYDLSAKKEYLLYDFGLSEKDSFKIEPHGFYINVDSIRTNNSKKYFYLSKNTQQTVWIEDIGCLDGLFLNSGNVGVGEYSTLLCCKSDDEMLYDNPEYNVCFIKTSTETLPMLNEKLIGITTSKEGVLIETSAKGHLSIYTLDGRLVLKQQIEQPETTLCPPETGVLLYRFTTTKGEVQTGKVLVE